MAVRGERFQELAELGRLPDVREVRIFADVLKIGVTKLDGPPQRAYRFIEALEERVRAGEVVPRQRIAAAQFDEPQVDGQPLLVQPALGIGIPQGHHRVDEIGIRGEEFFVEGDFEVEQFLRF